MSAAALRWGMSLPALVVSNGRILDEHRREVYLRGVNLGGDCKFPYPDGGTHHPDDFQNHRAVSFVGRPFPLSQAAEHLQRLRACGFNCLRLLTTWEAVEHAGPGDYDREYLDYFAAVARLCADAGFYMFIDFHQDVWSRMTGGDGAPGWTLEAAGLDIAAIHRADAALTMQAAYNYDDPRAVQPERYPVMCWSTNYMYPVNGLMWTLFFSGRDLAPFYLIEGQNAQDYLQTHYLGAMRAVAERVQDIPEVIGFDTLNEPGRGWCGRRLDDRRLHDRFKERGPALSPLDCLAILAGEAVEAPLLDASVWRGGVGVVGKRWFNRNRVRVFQNEIDPFQANGVWRRGTAGVEGLRPEQFRAPQGRALDFEGDHLHPFFARVAETIRSVRKDWIVFFEKPAPEAFANPRFTHALPENSINASHWYDLLTLGFKRFLYPVAFDFFGKRPVFGESGIRRMYVRQIGRMAAAAAKRSTPLLLGEFGIPFDLSGGRAFRRWQTGDRSAAPWRAHVRALSCMFDALDELRIHGTLWNYTASNRNDARIGDGWNQEDLSIYSADQQLDNRPESGLRAPQGYVRPWARAVQGRLLRARFDRRRRRFQIQIEVDASIAAPTELVAPRFVYPQGVKIDAPPELHCQEDGELLLIRAGQSGIFTITIDPRN